MFMAMINLLIRNPATSKNVAYRVTSDVSPGLPKISPDFGERAYPVLPGWANDFSPSYAN